MSNEKLPLWNTLFSLAFGANNMNGCVGIYHRTEAPLCACTTFLLSNNLFKPQYEYCGLMFYEWTLWKSILIVHKRKHWPMGGFEQRLRWRSNVRPDPFNCVVSPGPRESVVEVVWSLHQRHPREKEFGHVGSNGSWTTPRDRIVTGSGGPWVDRGSSQSPSEKGSGSVLQSRAMLQ